MPSIPSMRRSGRTRASALFTAVPPIGMLTGIPLVFRGGGAVAGVSTQLMATGAFRAMLSRSVEVLSP